jgi:hypothetical protein
MSWTMPLLAHTHSGEPLVAPLMTDHEWERLRSATNRDAWMQWHRGPESRWTDWDPLGGIGLIPNRHLKVCSRRLSPKTSWFGLIAKSAGVLNPELPMDTSGDCSLSRLTFHRTSDRHARSAPAVRHSAQTMADPRRASRGPSEAPREEQSRPAPPQLVSQPPRDDCEG